MDKLNDMFVAVLPIRAKKWKLLKYLRTGELKNKCFILTQWNIIEQ